ncbi:non-specific serine/threonine protein kinase [Entamoeba marina]
MCSKKAWGCLRSFTIGYEDIFLYYDLETIGRQFNNTLRQNTLISNKHLQIRKFDIEGTRTIIVEDISTNGTYINEDMCKETNLQHFDEIILLDPSWERAVHFMFIDLYIDIYEKSRFGPQCDYEIGKYLGHGGFARVREVIEKGTNNKFAMKIINIRATKKRSMIQNEINVMQCLDHENIIKLFKVYVTDFYIYLVLEHLQGGDLFDYIIDNEVTLETSKLLVKQILQALLYLKEHHIIHRDIKPENILFDSNKKEIIKLTDFGLSRKIDEDKFLASTLCGSDLFMAPEIVEKYLLGKPYNCSKVDVWSTGVILFVMTCGYTPFLKKKGRYAESICKDPINFKGDWVERGDEIRDLIIHMLEKDVERRYSVEQCLQHRFFD